MTIVLGSLSDRFQIETGLYPDNTPNINFGEAWDYLMGNFSAVSVQPRSIQEFFSGLMLVDSIQQRGGRVETLILPCIPGMRQDRMKWSGDMLMTLRYVAKSINAQGFRKVVTVDPHSLAVQQIDNLMALSAADMVWNEPKLTSARQWAGVIAPDAGASTRAQEMAARLGVPVINAFKRRDPASNNLSGFSMPQPLQEGEHYLVVDDICDAGGTFLGLADIIDQQGATASLYVTHGLFSKGAAPRLRERYRDVFSTDSVHTMYPEHVSYIPVLDKLWNFA